MLKKLVTSIFAVSAMINLSGCSDDMPEPTEPIDLDQAPKGDEVVRIQEQTILKGADYREITHVINIPKEISGHEADNTCVSKLIIDGADVSSRLECDY